VCDTQLTVGGDEIAGRKANEIARDDVPQFDVLPVSVGRDRGRRRDHCSKRLSGALRAVALPEVDAHSQTHHADDDHRVATLSKQSRHRVRDEQNHDESKQPQQLENRGQPSLWHGFFGPNWHGVVPLPLT